MTPSSIVTLTTDFGTSDGYVAAMKGVLLTMAPGAVLVDLSHDIERHDIVGAAYVLATVVPFYPPGTVHLVVVDPGVGSSRAAVALRTSEAWFVGPDNGVLWLAAGAEIEAVVAIEDVPGSSGAQSATFHGRDLFAPAAAHIVRTGGLDGIGPPLGEIEELQLPEPHHDSDGAVRGEVIHVDGFGNLITNIDAADLPGAARELAVEIGGTVIDAVVAFYAEVEPGALCALIGSDGHLEVAVNEGSAAARLGVGCGAELRCRRVVR